MKPTTEVRATSKLIPSTVDNEIISHVHTLWFSWQYCRLTLSFTGPASRLSLSKAIYHQHEEACCIEAQNTGVSSQVLLKSVDAVFNVPGCCMIVKCVVKITLLRVKVLRSLCYNKTVLGDLWLVDRNTVLSRNGR